MPMRGLVGLRVFAIAGVLLVTACGPSENEKLKAENADLQSQVDHLREKLDTVRSDAEDLREKVDTTKSSSNDLAANAARFNDDNWREVVPDVQAGSDQVDSDLGDVDSALNEVEAAAEDD